MSSADVFNTLHHSQNTQPQSFSFHTRCEPVSGSLSKNGGRKKIKALPTPACFKCVVWNEIFLLSFNFYDGWRKLLINTSVCFPHFTLLKMSACLLIYNLYLPKYLLTLDHLVFPFFTAIKTTEGWALESSNSFVPLKYNLYMTMNKCINQYLFFCSLSPQPVSPVALHARVLD